MELRNLNFIEKHFDFKIYSVSLLAFAALFAVLPCVLFLPEKYGFENGLIENLQLVVLIFAFIIALQAKDCKKF